MRYEIGWKCSLCEKSWRVSVRAIKTTIDDPKLKKFVTGTLSEVES